AALLSVIIVLTLRILNSPAQRELTQLQLTANSRENAVASGTISPDGKFLAYWDVKGIHLRLIDTGEERTISQPEALAGTGAEWSVGPWFPDGTRFLANATLDQHTSIWSVSAFGGTTRKMRDDGQAWSISPKNSTIVFTTSTGSLGDREVWLMESNGG